MERGIEMMDGRLLSRVAYTGRRPSWSRRKEGGHGVERTGNLATEKNNVGKKGAWIEHRDEWFWEEKERKEEELRHEVRSAALGRSIIQEGQNDGACLKRLEGMTARVAEDACSLLSRYGGRVGEVWLNVGSALFAPHIDLHHNVCFSWRYKCDVEGWQDMLKAAEKVGFGREVGTCDRKWHMATIGVVCGSKPRRDQEGHARRDNDPSSGA